MTVSNEFNRIDRFFKPLTQKMSGAFALSDDAALLDVKDLNHLVISTDTIVETIHFLGNEPAFSIARKLLGVNLSDLAAKGAQPYAYSLSLGLPSYITDDWIEDFANGLSYMQNRYNIHLLGGDSIHSPDKIILTVTAMGFPTKDGMIRRAGAKVGDELYVTGTIGDSALGLLVAKGELASDFLQDRYFHPLPRVEFIDAIANFATSSMDISDGLVGDCKKLVIASDAGANIYLDKIPLSADVKRITTSYSNMVHTALTGGDDYEILFTIPRQKSSDFEAYLQENQLSLSKIGEITANVGKVSVLDRDGEEVEFQTLSYSHT